MKKTTSAIAAVGAVTGVLLAIGGMVLAAGLLIDGGAQAITVRPQSGLARPFIEAEDFHLYAYVIMAGAVVGGLIGSLTSIFAGQASPDTPRFGVIPVTIASAVVGAIGSYAMLRFGLGIGGTITAGVVTLSAFRSILVFAATGAVVGGVSATISERLSRPEVMGLAGEAWPSSKRAFIRESMPAMLIPLGALIVIAAVVFGFSRALLAGNNALAVTLASALSVAILGGGALMAYSPRGREPEGD